MIEDRLPRGKVRWQVAPRTTSAQDVENGIKNGTQGVGWRPTSFGLRREMALQTLPLGIRKIAGITRTHPSSLSQSFSPSFQNTVLVGKAIDYYSCFISYSSKDDAFARRLHADLQSENVRCWFAPEDLKWGDKIRVGIDEAIRFHDKLLLILSKSSVASGWVEREVKIALTKERKEKRTVLFPVRVDRAVFESTSDWATEIRHERNIGDFTHWKDHDEYQKAFTRLLRDLQTQ